MTLSRLIILTLVLLQAACGSLRPAGPDTVEGRKGIEQQLLSMQCWSLNGKLGIRTPEDAHSIWMDWKQNGDFYQMRLSGPLGVGGAEISGGPDRVHMKVSEDRVLVGESPESLVEREFGWNLPLSSLVYWVRGIQAPGGSARQRLNDKNLLAELDQHGWHLNFAAYAAGNQSTPPLPEKIRLTHQDLAVTVIIKEWKPDACT